MTKVVYNACYGGFGLSKEAEELYKSRKGLGKVWTWEIDRTDPILVAIVEELGGAVNTRFSNLEIAEVPEGTAYRIDEYDGFESVMTVDDYDWKVAKPPLV